ncbi:hypothetical protein BJF79_47600 [Actinomadura sp. CNU-125]|uniref:nucleoside 2-deoxyribosyltransferase n=1 Tax=Actinomadura sp. CNU-125 TaxID=1904961 RepID=UPI00095DD35E|nr:nucleoside 2-deoxyribosyltransferase [Actinomadura sp. CNU-125]OLT19780.1 hypothetical protein BJF79_47600 [Actinomadura sp. CNU-125]
MAQYYIAHRLFAAHDRALAATLAHRLAEEHGPGSVFLPFCDTDEENLIAETKGRLLFELDTQCLEGITAMAAILHGPSLDDGVCMEIGHAAARGIPVIALTSDFLTYGPTPDDPAHCPFPDPLLTAATSAVIRTHRLGAAPLPASPTYTDFLTQNLATIDDLIDQTVRATHRLPRPPTPFPTLNNQRRIAYVEPSPYGLDDQIHDAVDMLRETGWDIHLADRFNDGEAVSERAEADWAALADSHIAVVDVRGPETPPGAAMVIGACAATGRPVYAPDPRCWWTFADGREPNYRNLMIQYGLTATFDRPQDVPVLVAAR